MEIQKYIAKFPNIRDANNHLRQRFGLRIKKDNLAFMDSVQKDETVFVYNAHEKDSPRCSPLVKEANGLILDTAGNVVSRSLDKIYSYDDPCNREELDWSTVTAELKYKGQMVTLFNHRGEWFIQDKWHADLADTDVEISTVPGMNLGMAVNAIITDVTKRQNPYKNFSPRHCYIFQLMEARVDFNVNRYMSRLVLLSIYDKGIREFLQPWIVNDFAECFGFKRPTPLLGGQIFYKEALSRLDLFRGEFVLVDEYGVRMSYTKEDGK